MYILDLFKKDKSNPYLIRSNKLGELSNLYETSGAKDVALAVASFSSIALVWLLIIESFKKTFNILASSSGNGQYSSVSSDAIATIVGSSNYVITSHFGDSRAAEDGGGNRKHLGIDIALPYGSPIYSDSDGKVVKINRDTNTASGMYVLIEDNDKKHRAFYMHLSSVNVSVGQEVVKGLLIAHSGNSGVSKSGKTYGAHLHWQEEESINNKWIPFNGLLYNMHVVDSAPSNAAMEQRANFLMEYLTTHPVRGHYLTNMQAAAFVGNFAEESGLRANAYDGGNGYGIAQWTSASRRALFRRVIGKDVQDATLAEQARFVVYELNNSKIYNVGFGNIKNLSLYTQEVMESYERPAFGYAHFAIS